MCATYVEQQDGNDEGKALAVADLWVISAIRICEYEVKKRERLAYNEYALSTLKRFSWPIPWPSLKKAW